MSQREELNQLDQSYGAIVKRQFLKNRPAVWSMRILFVIALIGLFADFIANDKPFYCKVNGKSYFPILKEYAVDLGIGKWPKDLLEITDWRNHKFDSSIRTLIPYSADTRDKYNAQYVGPFEKQRLRNTPKWRWKHYLGTDDIGRDVLSGMIHGTRIAMLVGLISMSIASFIGIIFGALMGYFGDDKFKMSRGRLWLNLIFFFFAFFYAFMVRGDNLSAAFSKSMVNGSLQLLWSFAIFFLVMIIPNLLAYVLKAVPFFAKKVSFPVDLILMRIIEVLRSIPGLLMILAIVAVFEASIILIMVVIGFLGWTGIARFVRGEMLRVRSLEYIEAAEALGFKRARIILRHAIPNSLTPVLIAIAFGIAGAILTESFLSFLGIGVPPETITWGKLLSLSRKAPEAWWLAIIPGFAIFVTVTIFNLLGDGLADAIDPKLKQ